jgi:DNA-binding transcriptional LysR family regulator
VSKVIQRLEERLGVGLLERTTRRLSLTPAGAGFHARTAHLLRDVAEAEAVVRRAARDPSGTLRIGAPVPFGQAYLAPLVGQLMERCPRLSVELLLQDDISDVIAEGIDLVVRIGALRDSRLVARKLCSNRRVLVASPEYLARRGTPQRPEDLSAHVCLPCTYMARPLEWRLFGPDGPVSVKIGGGIASNNIGILVSAAEQGLGISMGPTQSTAAALLAGRLVRVLADYEFERTGIYAIYPSRRQLSSKVRAAIDFLSERFSDPPSWDQQLAGVVEGFDALLASDAD